MKSKLSVLLLSALSLGALLLSTDSASAQAEYFDTAFKRAAMPGIRTSYWEVTAKVSLKATGKKYITARGKVKLDSDGMLTGELPLSIEGELIPNNTLQIHIRNSNPAMIVLNRNIAGKPLLGRKPVLFSLPVKAEFNYMNGGIEWHDGHREIRIDLETNHVKTK